MMLDAHWQADCWWLSLGLPRLQYEQIITAVYLKISIGDFLTLFSCRTGAKPFFAFAPSKILLGGACLSLLISTIVAIAWQRSSPDDVETLGLTMMNGDSDNNRYRHILLPLFIWYWCIVWWFIQDNIKMATHKLLTWYRKRQDRRKLSHKTVDVDDHEPTA
jgi:H+-transporting ATPase